MSERSHHRKPATFKLDDPGVIVMDPDETSRPSRGTVHVMPEAEPALLPVAIEAPIAARRRGFRWGALFWTAIAGLVVLATGLGVEHLIEDLFARSEGLGFLGLGFAFVAALAFAVVVAREAVGLLRLAAIEKLHARASAVLVERRSRGEPENRAGADPAGAAEPASGPCPRHAAGPCQRHHRRRRHDPAGGARADDAARPGSAPAGVGGSATRLARHRRQSRARWSTCCSCSPPRCG